MNVHSLLGLGKLRELAFFNSGLKNSHYIVVVVLPDDFGPDELEGMVG